MRSARRIWIVAIVAALSMAFGRPQASQRAADPTVPQLLAAAGRYVAGYESSFGAMVAQERYQQSTNGPANSRYGVTRRETTGDMLLFNSATGSGGAGWMALHDIQTMDTKPFPSEPGRLAALAANPARETLADAMRISAMTETYAIGNWPHTPPIPTGALIYLRAARQPFGVFEFDSMKTVGDVRVAVLKFSERPHARMTDADDFTTTGRFWIEPETGRVVQTELSLSSVTYTSKIEVQYASAPGMELWMPVGMFDQYNVTQLVQTSGGRIGGAAVTAYVDRLATYQGFQRFELKPGLLVR